PEVLVTDRVRQGQDPVTIGFGQGGAGDDVHRAVPANDRRDGALVRDVVERLAHQAGPPRPKNGHPAASLASWPPAASWPGSAASPVPTGSRPGNMRADRAGPAARSAARTRRSSAAAT